jgi:hypothetical protein
MNMPDNPETCLEPDLLRRFLHGRDVPCPSCQYNLRDLTGDRCPECGQAIALRLQLAEPKQAAMLAGLIALSAGVGLNGLLMIYYAIVILRSPVIGMQSEFLVVNLAGLAVEGAALAAWLWFWSRIRRMNGVSRWLLAAACFALTLANILVFSFTIR